MALKCSIVKPLARFRYRTSGQLFSKASSIHNAARSNRRMSSSGNSSHPTNDPWTNKGLEVVKLRDLRRMNKLHPFPLIPPTHDPSETMWKPMKGREPKGSKDADGLRRGDVLRIITWNLNASAPDRAHRASAAIRYLSTICCENPTIDGPVKTTIMLQEVCRDSLEAIMEYPWTRRHFNLSSTTAPESTITELSENTLLSPKLEWRGSADFTLMMISKDLQLLDCFRVPYFMFRNGRQVMIADIALSNADETPKKTDVLRLCNTHLEYTFPYSFPRSRQAALTALLRDDALLSGRNVVAGVVAGDLNFVSKSEHECSKRLSIRQDVWRDWPEEGISEEMPFERDTTNGLSRVNTWEYQRTSRNGKGRQVDEILHTGSLHVVPLKPGHQITRGVMRLGVGLTTQIEAYQGPIQLIRSSPSSCAETKEVKTYFSTEEIQRLIDKQKLLMTELEKNAESDFIRTQLLDTTRKLDAVKDAPLTTKDIWVSCHYGLMAKMKIL